MGKHKCEDCLYSWKTVLGNNGPIWACDYIGYHDKRRPCKYGPDCTVFEPKDKARIRRVPLNYSKKGIGPDG